ncbi:MAG TPA: glycosyltransferase [Alphaproteobacteria bacterium]|nr:glycosyltransferase [Alphaproteobacteria bacterium]
MPPKISVITAVYNAESFIVRTINSILDQTFCDFEYILVDDGSTDDSAAIIESIDDPRIRLLRNDGNRKLVYTRNRAIAASTGEFIAVTDHDDISLPTRLADQLAFLQSRPEVGLVGSWYDVIDESDQYIGHPIRRRYSAEEFRASLLFRNFVGHSTVMVRREALPDPPYASDYPLCEDYFLIAQIARRHKVALIPNVLVQYRAVAGAYTEKARPQMQALGRKLKRSLLQELGIDATDDEIAIHDNLSTRATVPTPDLAYRTELWLERLPAANDVHPIYDAAALRAIVGNEWFEFCREASFLGLKTWRRFRQSSLSRYGHYQTLDHLRLVQKCLFAELHRSAPIGEVTTRREAHGADRSRDFLKNIGVLIHPVREHLARSRDQRRLLPKN